jgi:hypothetical protein
MFYYEGRILRDVLKIVERRGNSSAIKGFLYAADRDFDITTLEKWLSDLRSSIVVCRRDSYYEVIGHPENLATTGRGRIGGSKFILHAYHFDFQFNVYSVTVYPPVGDRARSLPQRHNNSAAFSDSVTRR